MCHVPDIEVDYEPEHIRLNSLYLARVYATVKRQRVSVVNGALRAGYGAGAI